MSWKCCYPTCEMSTVTREGGRSTRKAIFDEKQISCKDVRSVTVHDKFEKFILTFSMCSPFLIHSFYAQEIISENTLSPPQ